MTVRSGRGLIWMAAIMAVAIPLRVVRAQETTLGFADIQGAFLRESFVEVAPLAQAFILQYPKASEVPRVWIWLALSLDRLQRSNEAVREIGRLKRRLRRGDPLRPEILFWEGDISRRAFRMARAKSAYRQLLDEYPDSTWASQARMGLGLIELHHQAFASAAEHFHAVSSEQAGTSAARDARLFEGVCHLKLKQFREAVAMFEPLLGELEGSDLIAQAALYLGESLSGLERYQEAIEAFRRALDASKTPQWSRPAQFGLGWAYYEAGQCEESLAEFEPYLRHRRVDYGTEARFALASCLMRLEREPEALTRFEQIVSRDPEHPLALESALVIVDASRREGRFARAKELLHAFLRRPLKASSRAQVQLRLGSIALEQGNVVQAKTIFTVATEHEDPLIRQTALSGLGDVQLYLGDLASAQRYYEDAMEFSGGTRIAGYAAYQVGRILLQLGDLDEAVVIFRRLVTHEDTALADDAHLALIIAYLNQKEEVLARALLSAIRSSESGSSRLRVRAVYYEALLALGEDDAPTAERLCEELIAEAPRTDEAFEARLLLADLRARTRSPQAVMEWLSRIYDAEPLSRNHRARLAKRLGDVARSDGAYPDAIRWYEEAVRLLPAMRGEGVYRLASCYEESGDVEAAVYWYQKITQPPWRVRGQMAAAKLLERQDRGAEARKIYERLAEEPIPEAKLIQERLATLREEEQSEERRW